MTAAKNLPSSITCRWCFEPRVPGRGFCISHAAAADDKLHADLVANAATMNANPTCVWDSNSQTPDSDLCDAHAASEAEALSATPHLVTP